MPQAKAALQSFALQYGLTIELPSASLGSTVTYDLLTSSVDLVKLKALGAVWVDEWSKYPKDWIAYSQATSVAFVKDLNVLGDRRGAAPDQLNDRIIYDVSLTMYGSTYTREVIHHEFAHLIVSKNFGVYATSFDPAWTSYDPPAFQYGPGGANCRKPGAKCPVGARHPTLGFVSGYATSAIEEDEAETYAYLMTAAYYPDLKTWISSDPYLAKKVASCERWMQLHSPEMSGPYFDRINR